MIAPTLVEYLQHDVSLDLLRGLETAGEVLGLLLVLSDRLVDDERADLFGVGVDAERLNSLIGRIVRLQIKDEGVNVPLFVETEAHVRSDGVGDALFDEFDRGVMNIFTLDHL